MKGEARRGEVLGGHRKRRKQLPWGCVSGLGHFGQGDVCHHSADSLGTGRRQTPVLSNCPLS